MSMFKVPSFGSTEAQADPLRRQFFELIQPICPACREAHGHEIPLVLHAELHGTEHEILHGLLSCPQCMREFPIIDGIPILVSDVRTYIQSSMLHLHWRGDLPEPMMSLLGDCAGPGSPFELTRYYLSTYGWGHYHDLDPLESSDEPPKLIHALDTILNRVPSPDSGLVVDLGCSVGRSSFHLASKTRRPVLGLDLNFSMLRAARQAAQGMVCYPLRIGGLMYERREFSVHFPMAEQVDFWVADATNLPLSSQTISLLGSLNLLDCVASPYAHLQELFRTLKTGGHMWVGCPYDWSSAATAPTHWLGGHSYRGEADQRSRRILHDLLTPGRLPHSLPTARIVAEFEDLPWTVRLHERSKMHYDLHAILATTTVS